MSKSIFTAFIFSAMLVTGPLYSPDAASANPCNPCAGKKMGNPCNPCAKKKSKNPCNPCGGKMANPCNPCGGDKVDPEKIEQPRRPKMIKGNVKRGAKLWEDRELGKSGLACSTCHINKYGQMQDTFANDYPHYVKMAKDRAGLGEVNAAEMVQLCIVVPMMSEPLKWDSQELADLTAYVEHIQRTYQPQKSTKNPCSGKKMKNPCAGKKMGNPCNPCGR